MLSLRRYAVYFGLAVCVLLTLTVLRRPILSRTPFVPLRSPFNTGEVHVVLDPAGPEFRWENVPVRYPVKSLTPLPTDNPRPLPKVQHGFEKETTEQAAVRKKRLTAVRSAFERCWKAYREHAWMKDELAPMSGGSKDPFGGWAANLIDNLDTLWIMDMKAEFEEAVQAATTIDFRRCTQTEINVFETTIRHLGGLLSAYDLSMDDRLLEKAKEVGSMLIVAFDTPNRMPITRWDWAQSLAGRQLADEHVLVAEIGSLSMEFTRLSMLTGDPKWYDAIERIVRILEEQQFKTILPGMWPVTVNAYKADFTQDSFFTLSAMADSLYEYFPKMHALLGGVDARYRKLYESSMETAVQYNLWRPMTPDNADILVSGQIRKNDRNTDAQLDAQGQHLVCFAGGMFALGGKLFDIPAHVEIGQKITDGCIWAYKALPLGIMPEVFRMVPCESRLECKWNETAWKEAVEAEHPNGTPEADTIIQTHRLPKGFTDLTDGKYVLRPEAIESVFILYRITGEQYLQDAAWDMFTAITNWTQTPLANSALHDISYTPDEIKGGKEIRTDSMESFWMAETLKYFYLMFSAPDVISLDEYVFNTEAHPFKRRLPD